MANSESGSPPLPPPSQIMGQAARELRQRQTPAEVILWARLRGRRFLGRKFRRQHPIGQFVVDFFCDDARLAIELDGAVHQDPEQRERDAYRERILSEFGLTVLRFENSEVQYELEGVLARIEAHLLSHSYEGTG